MSRKGNKDFVGRLLLAVVVIGLGAIVGVKVAKRKSQTPEMLGAVSETGQTQQVAGLQVEVSPMHQLEGRWLRPDGGYILELRGAGPDGKIEASYFNPRPIHVSRAETSEEGERLKLLVELQDSGYPGCVYTLYYEPDSDGLTGTYYQAALRETFTVQFVRSN